MKKIFLGMLMLAFMASPALASNGGGGKKKAKKKARTECKAKCDPKDCDPKNCDPKCCDYKACPKEEKCTPASTCTGS
jgi:hypothetical protein